MPFKKGESGNRKGRPNGAENKTTVELRDRIKAFLDGNFKTVQRDFKKLDPEKRIALYERYLKFVLPSLQATEISLDIEKMSDAELDLIISRLISKQ